MLLRMTKIILSVFVFMFISSTAALAWSWLIASDGDPLTFTKWNELVAYVNTKISSGVNLGTGEWIYAGTWATWTLNLKTLKAGSGVTLSSSANEITIESTGWGGSITTESINVAIAACSTSTTPYKTFMNAYAPVAPSASWAEVNAVGTIDPDNTSTWDASLIDNNYTSLTYNNSSQGSANKSLPAIDLWSSTNLWSVRIYWWNPQTYGTTNWNIQWSNNGTTWANLATWIVKSTGATGDFTDHPITGSWRYIRFFNITGLNTDWVTLGEIEAFQAVTTTAINYNVFSRDIEIRESGWFVEVCNNEANAITVEINSLQ